VEIGGKGMRRSTLVSLICENVEEPVVLSARGYRSVVFFRNSTIATMNMIKDDDEDENLEAALDVVATDIKKESYMMEYKHRTYHTNISKEIAEYLAPDTLQQLLRKMFIGEQSLPSLLIGSIVNSTIKKHPITLGVYFYKKKTVKHMHDCLVCYSYELLRFKKKPRQWQNTSRFATTDGNSLQWKDLFKSQ